MSATTEARKSKIEIRTTRDQKQLIEQAAQAEGVNLSSFVFGRAFSEAQRVLSDRALFILDEASWRKLGKILDHPPKPSAKLRELMQNPSVLEQRKAAHGRNRKD